MSLPYWRLSGFYFFYFAFVGASVPYWNVYLEHLSFTPQQIGLITGAVMGTRIFAPSLWGMVADRSGKPLQVIRLGNLLAMVIFAAVLIFQGFTPMLLIIACYSFFWNAVLSQFEVVTLRHLGSQYRHYARIRLWGSLGFIASVAGLGLLFEWVSVAQLPVIMLLFLAATWLCSLWVPIPPQRAEHSATGQGIGQVLAAHPVIPFLVISLLMQISHGPYYTFFSVYMADLGYHTTTIGALWALGVVAEVMLYVVMHKVLLHYRLSTLLQLSLLLASIRWLLTGYLSTSLPVLLLMQCLHAATFGVFHAVSIEWIRRAFPAALAGQGQALYSGITYGVGGAVGAVLSGLLWVISPSFTFTLAAASAALALLLSLIYLRRELPDG